MKYKTGLIRSPEPPRLHFGTYLTDELPAIPPTFGLADLFPIRGWGFLGNDTISDCTVAGAMHICMLWAASANKPAYFSKLDAIDDYHAITGGDDSGATMLDQCKYWKSTGFRDRDANRHKILAYMHVDPNNLEHIDAACYLFGAIGLGIKIGDYEQEQFAKQKPWVNPNHPIDGYHYAPMVGKTAQYRQVVTWGGLQEFGEQWFQAKTDEVVAVLTDENITDGKSLQGFDMDQLAQDLVELAG